MSLQTETIAIFQCLTTCPNSVEGLTTLAVKTLGRKVCLVSSDKITDWLTENNSLLMLPGGVCSGWDKVLPEDFQENLANWVVKGNKIFATCAGAYYCSKETIFSVSGREPINKSRNVQLFSGKCIGPLYEHLKVVKIRWHNGNIGHVILMLGGVFETEMEDNLKILGTFECKKNKGPAVVQSNVGNGIAILSSLHWEWNSQDLIRCNATLGNSKIVKKLDASQEFRQECVREIMQTLVTKFVID